MANTHDNPPDNDIYLVLRAPDKLIDDQSNMQVCLQRSLRTDKKWMVRVDGKTVHFGATGYQDYTTHKDAQRKQRYINRHRAREDWTKRGVATAGFWARWLLWNQETLRGIDRVHRETLQLEDQAVQGAKMR